MSGHDLKLNTQPQRSPAECKHEHALKTQGDLATCGPDWPLRECSTLQERIAGGHDDNLGVKGHLQTQGETTLGEDFRLEEPF